ncbi:J domain-containing protein [Legionella fallonii]|uniref:J domain-containing protein n=1 Tax=Legionella fallonii LLAP-10 TaxID=1212491 RepID=A0A098G5T2_9GAMM|nr:J domain-containing protein [Legionella fallonii]CEG56855.1 protein of unknown function [Heat shock protein DnaJ, N-terminal motif] [Legionella fallonii LLAP-10]
MADYYAQLGLTQDANEEEIKKAYRRLVLATHPDRVPGKEEEFLRIQEAYDTFWEMINYVDYRLCRRQERLHAIYRRNPSDEVKTQLRLIDSHLTKICTVVPVILGCDKRKRLYDLAMGFNHSDEMLEIERLIGGKDVLIQHINQQKTINSAEGIFALRDAHCLTPANFKQLTLIDSESDLFSLSMILDRLWEVSLLTQGNFERLMQQHQHACAIHNGVGRLQLVGILNQKYFEIVLLAGKKAKSVGSAIEYLYEVGLLNDETLRVVSQKNMVLNIWPPLYAMEKSGELNEETSRSFLWTGPPALHLLTHRLDQMIAHGVYLISQDVEKGKTALLLGLELKKDLKAFFERPLEEQKENLSLFKESFMHKLHAKDDEMAIHREQWKIIVVNIAIALTGIGLIALGIQYALNKRCFFAPTQREQLIENIAQTEWLSPGCS